MDLSRTSLKRLELFLAVAAEGNIAGTAKILGLSQPGLSRQIALLEREAGARLLARNGRGVRLTAAGRAFAGHAADAVRSMNKAAEAVAAASGKVAGTVRLGLPPTVAHVLAVPLIELLQARFPGIGITVLEGYSGHVLEWLSKGRLDLGVLYATGQTSTLVADMIEEEELDLILPPGMPAIGSEASGSQIAELDLILPSAAHGLRQLVGASFASAGIPLTAAMQVDSFQTTLRLVEEGKGCTILPRVAVRDRVAEGRLRAARIVQPELRRKVLMATSPAHPPSEAVRTLASFARRNFRGLLRGRAAG